MPAQFDPITYTDWDAIQTVVYEQIGPLQEVIGEPGIFVEGTGYGLAQNDLKSRAYPFSRAITLISSDAQAVVTFDSDHDLTAGEVIFFTNFNNSWGSESISNNFATVQSVIDDTRVLTDYSTFGFTPWGVGNTAEAVQYYISANQFINLRADLAKAVTHITGSAPSSTVAFLDGTPTELPVPVRGDIIYHSVYNPYYTVSTAANTYKYLVADVEQASYDANMPVSANNTSTWGGLTEYEVKITWPGSDGYDFVQYFNTGGLIKVDMLNLAASNQSSPGQNNNLLNASWVDLLQRAFPLYIGGKDKNTMGLSADARSFSTVGAFDLTGTATAIFFLEQNVAAYSNYSDHYVQVIARQPSFQRDMNITIQLFDSSTSNSFASVTDIDRKLQITLLYSTGAVPIAANPANITVTRVTGWT